MAYVLNQFNKQRGSSYDSQMMEYITSGSARRRPTKVDTGVSGNSVEGMTDECLQLGGGSSFQINNNYYFHGKFKRLDSDQTIYIKLVNYSSTESLEQYLKTVTIAKGDVHEWVDLEFIFTPYSQFDSILFELQRTEKDYTEGFRYPVIIYEEISLIKNIVGTTMISGKPLIKIGVQSRPGLMMCINGEEFRTPRSGIYEIRNGLMTVNFFSVTAAAADSRLDAKIAELNAAWDAAADKKTVYSYCMIDNNNSSKTRVIDGFTIDYMYNQES